MFIIYQRAINVDIFHTHIISLNPENLESVIRRVRHKLDVTPIILYKKDFSPPARTVLVITEILGLNIETRELNLFNNEQLTPEYCEKNPVHTIPLLEDGDFVLADSHAIINYLVSKYGAEQADELYPSDLEDRAIIHQRLFLDASVLFPRLKAIVSDILLHRAKSIDKTKEANVEEAYGFLEKYLQRSPFLAGENITIADIACVTTVSTLNVMVPIGEEYPKLQAWLDILSTQEWYQKKNQPGVNDFSVIFAAQLQKKVE